MFLLHRYFCGHGVVLIVHSYRLFVAGFTNTSFRGMASTFLDIIRSVGPVVVVGATTNTHWYLIAGTNAIMVIMLSGAVFDLPERPSFLAVQNKEREALKTFQLIRGPKTDLDAESAFLELRDERRDGNSGVVALFKPDMLFML